jgi:tyrosine-protein kinase Etk/Wzc
MVSLDTGRLKDSTFFMTTQESALPETFVAKSGAADFVYPRLSVFEVASTLLRRKRTILAGTVAVAAITAVYAFRLPATYRAEATIMPPQQQQSSLSALASMSSVGSGMASQLGLKSPGDLYVGILRSRSVGDNLAKRFHLGDVYHTSHLSDTRKALLSKTNFVSGKDSLITIAVQDKEADRAADLANAYVDELYKLNSRLALTDASQRRLFYEQQLDEQREALSKAEVEMKKFQQATGMLMPAGQSEVLVHANAQLRAEIASREVEMQALRTYATDENPKLQILKREIEASRVQLSATESNGSDGSKLNIPGGRIPEDSLEYVRKLRDVKYHESLYELFARQYEAARMDEAKQAPVIQVVDRAIPPDKANTPPRLAFLVGAAVVGFLLSSGFVIGSLWTAKFLAIWRERQQGLSVLPDALIEA